MCARGSSCPGFSKFGVHPLNEQIQAEAGEENGPGNDGARESRLVVTCEIGFQRGAHKPNLYDQENDDERHRTINRRHTRLGGS